MSKPVIADYPPPLPNPPSDGITSLTFSHFSDGSASQSNVLLSSSWDGTLRQYAKAPTDPSFECKTVQKAADPGVPLLSAAFGTSTRFCYAGGLDGVLYQVDMERGVSTPVGRHEKAISALVTCSTHDDEPEASPFFGVMASGSWDGTVKLWSTSSPTSAAAGSLASISAGGKVFAMDWVGSTLMVATSGRKVLIFEVKKAGDSFEVSQVQARDSSLKFQTRSCALFPDRTGFALGSIEGRVAIEYMEETDVAVAQGKKKYAFKCHRVGDVVYPVNAIAFHPVHGTFATGGCDGQVVLWDARHKKRLVALPRLETSVACLAFSKGGDAGRLLAVAQSYTFEEGEKDHPPDQIYVRELFEHEVKASGA
eukprot:CAMPEP_0182453450 /NCGR_PEP_ID=MMETSP1319-20130603/510_1 /TAXON_ID=172717 /ORGANISM="Bolidomonas pacifica, Strain RCC208" /LENGTH=366 /DNA_ID=CAMNT_0024651385 /DNA_START=161 /DNA_END=1257 /DNA_ORIENTATION=+